MPEETDSDQFSSQKVNKRDEVVGNIRRSFYSLQTLSQDADLPLCQVNDGEKSCNKIDL